MLAAPANARRAVTTSPRFNANNPRSPSSSDRSQLGSSGAITSEVPSGAKEERIRSPRVVPQLVAQVPVPTHALRIQVEGLSGPTCQPGVLDQDFEAV